MAVMALRSDAAKVLLGWTLFGLSTGVSVSLMAFTLDQGPQDLWSRHPDRGSVGVGRSSTSSRRGS